MQSGVKKRTRATFPWRRSATACAVQLTPDAPLRSRVAAAAASKPRPLNGVIRKFSRRTPKIKWEEAAGGRPLNKNPRRMKDLLHHNTAAPQAANLLTVVDYPIIECHWRFAWCQVVRDRSDDSCPLTRSQKAWRALHTIRWQNIRKVNEFASTTASRHQPLARAHTFLVSRSSGDDASLCVKRASSTDCRELFSSINTQAGSLSIYQCRCLVNTHSISSRMILKTACIQRP